MSNQLIADMASGNIQCSIAEQNRNIFNIPVYRNLICSSHIQVMESKTANTDLFTPSDSQQFFSDALSFSQQEYDPELANNNSNENSPKAIIGELILPASQAEESISFNQNNFPENCTNRNLNDYQKQRIQISIPEEPLTIQVNTDDAYSGHSWRPHLSNSLGSDVFLEQPLLEAQSGLNIIIPVESDVYPLSDIPPLIQTDRIQQNTDDLRRESLSQPSSQTNDALVNIQGYLHSQKSQMNILKYEVLNAQRKLTMAREEVEMLTRTFKEQTLFHNSQDIEKLNEENRNLRLECQCLCLEVDHHLKGKAPLGEIDEDFYQRNVIQNKKNYETEDALKPELHSDELNKWNCSTCTFQNHPAISDCEMCHMPRQKEETYLSTTPESCFCHPKVNLDDLS